MEKNVNIQQALFFLKKYQAYKTKNIINIIYLLMVLIRNEPISILGFSPYGLACKYRIFSQTSIYNWMQNWIFWYIWYCVFIFLRSNCSLVTWFVTWQIKNSIISSDSNLKQKIIKETIKVKEIRRVKIEFWRIPELMVHLEDDLYF